MKSIKLKLLKALIVATIATTYLGATSGVKAQPTPIGAPVPKPAHPPALGNISNIVICPGTCRNLTAAKVYSTNIGAMPLGNFQIAGLAPGQYQASSGGYAAKSYLVGKNGVLNGQLGTHRKLLPKEVTEARTNSVDGVAWCSAKNCYPTLGGCYRAKDYCTSVITF